MTKKNTHIIVAPGGMIGILGGGQLGRMLSLAASRLGLNCHIYCPEENGPASKVSTQTTVGAYEDVDAVFAFAKSCDVVTYEFENVPAKTAKAANNAVALRPKALALDVAQDRLTEKTFIRDKAGVGVTLFEPVESVYDLERAVRKIGLPSVLKTRRMGYDGKGQYVIRSQEDIKPSWAKMNDAPSILEKFVDFTREVSVIAARNVQGETAAYPLIENIHKDHILHTSLAPAMGDTGKAGTLARKIMDALDYVGVLAVEFFELPNGDFIVNEIAPRVHNSGHWTQDAGCVDQFELHIRAICGWPLGNTSPRYTMQMTNLLGEDVNKWAELAKQPDTALHLYGKSEPRKGRKMGHINRKLGPL